MKLKSILICLFIGFGLALQAQTISVKSFQALPMDMTASSLEGKRIDQNGEAAALIKVVTSQMGFTFEGGALGVVDTQQRNGEIWVWVPRASRKITILHQQLGVLRDYRFPIEIESERTYEMVLTTGNVETIVKQEVTQQYLAFRISPANATLFVNDELWEVGSDGSAVRFVPFGTYSYRVMAANYHQEIGTVTVNDPENTQTVPVTLKPDFVEVTLKVDADAEIWVNNEKKGTRTWTGNLGKGTYKIECKQAGHENSMITKEITADLNGQTIDLPKPTPTYGSLNIESTPSFATIYIDGKEVGETPKFVKEIPVGDHQVKVYKDDYVDYVGTISVCKGERKQVKAVLEPKKQNSTNNKGMEATINHNKTANTFSNVHFGIRVAMGSFSHYNYDFMNPESEFDHDHFVIGGRADLTFGDGFEIGLSVPLYFVGDNVAYGASLLLSAPVEFVFIDAGLIYNNEIGSVLSVGSGFVFEKIYMNLEGLFRDQGWGLVGGLGFRF